MSTHNIYFLEKQENYLSFLDEKTIPYLELCLITGIRFSFEAERPIKSFFLENLFLELEKILQSCW